MIQQLIKALNQELKLSATEIADIIWLALQMQKKQSNSITNIIPQESSEIHQIQSIENAELPSISNDIQSSVETVENLSPAPQKAGIYPRNSQQTSKTANLSFKVPDAPSLRDSLILARALKPLIRPIATGKDLILDENATTQKIADEGLWIPVLKPNFEPWLDLELVIDENISMLIWRHTIKELERLLKNYGIFRDVRIWGLITDENNQIKIRRGIGIRAKNQTLRSPKELINPSDRSLILIVSDCVSNSWYEGEITKILALWANKLPIAIIQMLPKYLWQKTGLRTGSEIRLRSLNAGVANQYLRAKTVAFWDELDQNGVKVPIFSLEIEQINNWAQMLSGKGSISAVGYLLKSDIIDKENNEFNAKKRVQSFLLNASPMARKLASLLSAAPMINLPIVRLIQETMLKKSLQINVAEVFLGGLLRPLSEIKTETNPDDVLFDFMGGVRELLIESLPSNNVFTVIEQISEYVAKKAGLSLEDFNAVLKKEKIVTDSNTAGKIDYFATVTAQVLRSLGGEYAEFAEQLEGKFIDDETNNNNAENTVSNHVEKIEEKYNFLWQEGSTKIYSYCTDEPWALPFDALVIPTMFSIPQNTDFTESYNDFLGFKNFLGESNFKWLVSAILPKINLNQVNQGFEITFEKALLIPLPSQIKSKFPQLDINKSNPFFILTTLESPESSQPTITDVFQATQAIISKIIEPKITRLVIPLVSSGHEHLPINKVAIAMLSAMTQSLKNLPYNPIKEIIIVDKKESTIEIINKTAHNLLNHQPTDKNELTLQTEIDYTELVKFLTKQNWAVADYETAKLILKVTGKEKIGYLKVKDIQDLPIKYLQDIDQLWIKYSNGRFGFSIQKNIWNTMECNKSKNIEKLKNFGRQIGIYIDDNWLLRDQLNYTTNAPIGHLPALGAWVGGHEQNCIEVLGCDFQGCGYVWTVAVISEKLSQTLQTFNFETVTVNSKGKIIITETKQAQYFTEILPDNIQLEMIAIPGGKFMMGSPENEAQRLERESPQHLVTVQPFFIGKYPITQAQWKAIALLPKINIELNPDTSHFKAANKPVEGVSWYEAVEFCDRLSKLTGKKYRLPSEAEWEYACRAGTNTPFAFGETLTDKLANYDATTKYADEPIGEYREETTPVGSFYPNNFGLYDMHGNVREWCGDHWHKNYEGATVDGSVWNIKGDNKYRVIRGGSWKRKPQVSRSASRHHNSTDPFNNNIGFRIVCEAETNNIIESNNSESIEIPESIINKS